MDSAEKVAKARKKWRKGLDWNEREELYERFVSYLQALHWRKAYEKAVEQLIFEEREMLRRLKLQGGNCGDGRREPSPWQENAVKHMEDG